VAHYLAAMLENQYITKECVLFFFFIFWLPLFELIRIGFWFTVDKWCSIHFHHHTGETKTHFSRCWQRNNLQAERRRSALGRLSWRDIDSFWQCLWFWHFYALCTSTLLLLWGKLIAAQAYLALREPFVKPNPL
jgi:hypothetical protein